MTTMPYGGVINWSLPKRKSVHDPDVHHGYRHIVAWGVDIGSHAFYIAEQCDKARQQDAPKNAIYLSGSGHYSDEVREWQTFDSLYVHNPELAKKIESYLRAMEKLEKRKKCATNSS